MNIPAAINHVNALYGPRHVMVGHTDRQDRPILIAVTVDGNTTYTNATLDEAAQIARQIVAAIDQHRALFPTP